MLVRVKRKRTDDPVDTLHVTEQVLERPTKRSLCHGNIAGKLAQQEREEQLAGAAAATPFNVEQSAGAAADGSDGGDGGGAGENERS